MITRDGWFDWARREEGPPHKVVGPRNTCSGYVPHSAVGFYGGWKSRLFGPDEVSVHGWIGYDGTVTQHYPLTACCWGSGSPFPNCNFIAFENEGGPPGNESEPLTEPQIEANVRIIRELAQWAGWTGFRRPTGPNDVTANLYEHNECRRWGSTATACPSGRIPWDEILARLASAGREPRPATGEGALAHRAQPLVTVRLGSGAELTLDIDEYVKGVVPAEMGTGWPLEALKAQAVAAKSYALGKGGSLQITTADQVYAPEKRADDTDAAVEAVRGIYAGYQGQVAITYYHAHCAGQTRTPVQAGWHPVAERPFLQAVECPCGSREYFGHGIGMCQHGARVMAQRGATFDQILRHYYPGIELMGLTGTPPVEFQLYEVREGDSLLAIAQRFGIEWGEIFSHNRDLLSDPNILAPGTRLRVPVPPLEVYEVQPGDTLFSLARRWGSSVQAIASLNGIEDPGRIRAGQRIRRPR